MDTPRRSMAKAISWRIIATVITSSLALALTGHWEFAATIGLIDTLLKFLVYFGHERLWNQIAYGRAAKPSVHIGPGRPAKNEYH